MSALQHVACQDVTQQQSTRLLRVASYRLVVVVFCSFYKAIVLHRKTFASKEAIVAVDRNVFPGSNNNNNGHDNS